ncbi:MAG TPA: EAL domain-containing response regulator [Steroidobacteraceae bacterium]|nr:EAL domain-containing response regulator [Steroidobacteraceae bacterium]
MSNNSDLPVIGSVLVVDDTASQRAYTMAVCLELGVQTVIDAANGREALAKLDALTTPPDLLIVDLEMPVMDGPELLEHLRQRGLETPILVASSREQALLHSVQDMGSSMGLHILGVLSKPIHTDALAATLKSLPAAGARKAKRAPARAMVIEPEVLSAAIDRDEIKVHYQPQVEMRSGEVHGVEALARWIHPQLGFVPPDQFIPVAEQHGLIHKLTLSVMRQAMVQTAAWNNSGLDLAVAINLSPLLFDRADLLQEISQLQQSTALPANRVVLEVTESSLMRELSVALAVLTRLRLRGFGLSLDDYGTGFSSLQQLARIPFTELKIDRSFVQGAHSREGLQVMLRSTLEMAERLKVHTVAEGVESLDDWKLLQGYGCTLVQGWLFAKAMPAAEFDAWYKTHRARKLELHSTAAAG